MSATIQLRRDTSANWTAANPVLAIGEIGLNTDDLSYKIGNGATAWNGLSYRPLTGTFNDRLTLEGIATPSAPSADNLIFWAANVGGRMLPRIMGPTGVDTSLQPALWGNGVVIVTPAATNAFSVQGTGAPTAFGTIATPLPSTGTNLRTATRRTTLTSSTTANQATSLRLTATPVYRGEDFGTAKAGGFFLVSRTALSSATALQRQIVGLVGASTSMAVTQNPSALTNCIFLGNDSADTNMQIMHNDGADTCTKIDLGANFPSTNSAAIYEFIVFCKPNGDEVSYRVTRLDTGDTAIGTITTNLPSKATLLYYHAYANNGGTAASVVLEFMRLYIETDY